MMSSVFPDGFNEPGHQRQVHMLNCRLTVQINKKNILKLFTDLLQNKWIRVFFLIKINLADPSKK